MTAGYTGSRPDEIRLTEEDGVLMWGSIDEHYAAKYKLPNCSECGQDTLTYNTYEVYEVQLFCANDQCPAFVKTFWVKKSELEKP